MSKEEALELLNKFTPQELTLFLYRDIFGLSVHSASRRRRQKYPAYIYLSNQVNKKLATYDNHLEVIACIQELFKDCRPDSFFV